MASGRLSAPHDRGLLDLPQVIERDVGKRGLDLRPCTAGEAVPVTPERNGTRRIAGFAGDSGRPSPVVDELNSGLAHRQTLLSVRFQRKRNLTPGKITISKVVSMDDSSWLSLRDPWTRLRWARMHWQTKAGGSTTMRAAAESLGMGENTYSAYEREPGTGKATHLDHQRAIQFAKKFRINWVWLLTGEETPFDRTPEQARVVAAMRDLSEDEQDLVATMAERLQEKKAS